MIISTAHAINILIILLVIVYACWIITLIDNRCLTKQLEQMESARDRWRNLIKPTDNTDSKKQGGSNDEFTK